VATARDPAQLAELASRHVGSMRAVALDVTNEVQAKAAFEPAIASFGSLDVLVNNAGYATWPPLKTRQWPTFRAQIETNLFGVINHDQGRAPYFRERRAGHIIQVASIGGTRRTRRARTVRGREVRR